MGWKGTLRSLNAIARQIEQEQRAQEREAKRRHRELERQQAQRARMHERERAEHEVRLYEALMEVLLSIHTECSSAIEWKQLAAAEAPLKPPMPQFPEQRDDHEYRAQEAFERYQASFWDWLFGQGDEKREQLKRAVKTARMQDKAEYEEACREAEAAWRRDLDRWRDRMKEWEEVGKLAKKVLAGDPEAYAEAIKEMSPFAEMETLGAHFNFSIKAHRIIVNIAAHEETAIPAETKHLTKTGKVSTRSLSRPKRLDLYQTHLCSCVIRVARELFALLPVKLCLISASVNMIDHRTGHRDSKPILSVAIPRVVAARINWNTANPVGAMSNFAHQMSFKRSSGFEPIIPLRPEEISSDNL